MVQKEDDISADLIEKQDGMKQPAGHEDDKTYFEHMFSEGWKTPAQKASREEILKEARAIVQASEKRP